MFCSGSSDAIWLATAPAWRLWFGSAAQTAGMLPTWAGLFAGLGSIIAVAAAIRLMDDFLDLAVDESLAVHTLAGDLREAALPYALAAFACSAALMPKLSIALFAAAYFVGMTGDQQRVLPLGMQGWQEGLLLLLVGAFGAGVACAAWALFFMIALQTGDDLADRLHDRASGVRNLCQRYGVGETALAGVCSLLLCLILSPVLTLLGYLALGCTAIAMPRRREQGGAANG